MAREVGGREIESLSARLGFPETTIEVGLTHPGVRRAVTAAGGTASFLVDLDDDRMTALEVEIGLGHRGFEKEAEARSFEAALPYVARLGFGQSVLAETAYCLALESLADLVLPDRAIWLRMLVGELARITDHFARMGAVMSAIGLRDGELVANRGEVVAARSLAAATGGGPFEGFVRPGGVARGLSEDFASDWPEIGKRLVEHAVRFDDVAIRNPTSVRRLRGVAELSAEDAIAWSVTGPPLRATGDATDLRRDRPYLAYGALDFGVPVGETGDGLDRLLVVVEEIRQSVSMIDQCHKLLVSLGPGEVRTPESDEALSNIPAGESVAAVEASTGELGFLLVSDGEGAPRRVRCRAPSFFHAQVLPTLLVGERLDDLLPTVAGLHLVAAECDR